MPRLLVVDDHVLFREGLISLLNNQPDFTVVGQAGSTDEAIALARDLQPDLVLMDIGLSRGSGVDATKAILANRPETKVVFLTVHEDDALLFDAIRAGGRGYLLKNVPVVTLLAYLHGVVRGEPALTPEATSRILDEFGRQRATSRNHRSELGTLSARELEVLQLLRTGATNREIAERLSISNNTAKNHVHNILTKLGLGNRRQAALYRPKSN